MRRVSPAVAVILGTAAALALAVAAGWAWNVRVSNVEWGLAEVVRRAARRDISFMGEMGGRAPRVVTMVQHSWAVTIAVAWAIFVLAVAGLSAERVAAQEPVAGARSWGLLATIGFMTALTLVWLGVTFT
jgi:hypothetical protein